MLPHAGQPRQNVLELRQLDLKPRLPRPCPPREDVEDETAPVHDAQIQFLLEIAALRGREVVVHEQEGGVLLLG